MARKSQNSAVYHVAPTDARESIEQYGIDSARSIYDRWNDDSGFYAFTDLDEARWFRRQMRGYAMREGEDIQFDIWAVTPTTETEADYSLYPEQTEPTSAIWHPETVGPENAKRIARMPENVPVNLWPRGKPVHQLNHPKVLYHASPTVNRDLIRRWGLGPSDPADSLSDTSDMYPVPNDTGVYLTDDPERWRESMEAIQAPSEWQNYPQPTEDIQHPKPYDVWEIDATGLDPLYHDRILGSGAFVYPGWIGPERLLSVHDSDYLWPEKLPPNPYDIGPHDPEAVTAYLGDLERIKEQYPDLFTYSKTADVDYLDWDNPDPNADMLLALQYKQPFFHMAPTEDRARIFQHGLIASDPLVNNPWLDKEIRNNPTGVYLVDNEIGLSYLKDFEHFDRPTDIWKVELPHPVNEETIIHKDPASTHGYYVKGSILPEMLELVQGWEEDSPAWRWTQQGQREREELESAQISWADIADETEQQIRDHLDPEWTRPEYWLSLISKTRKVAAEVPRWTEEWDKYYGPDWEGFRNFEEYIEYVPTQALWEFREYDRPLDDEYTADLAKHIKTYGIRSPIILEYNVDTGQVHIGEGNHRLKIALEQGLEAVPVRVYTSRRQGKNYGMVPEPYPPDQFDYVPQHLKPSDIGLPTMPEGWRPPPSKLAAADEKIVEVEGQPSETADQHSVPWAYDGDSIYIGRPGTELDGTATGFIQVDTGAVGTYDEVSPEVIDSIVQHLGEGFFPEGDPENWSEHGEWNTGPIQQHHIDDMAPLPSQS